jgi:hypothetical protein
VALNAKIASDHGVNSANDNVRRRAILPVGKEIMEIVKRQLVNLSRR